MALAELGLGKGARWTTLSAPLEDIVSYRTIQSRSLENAARTLTLVLSQLNLAFNPAKIILAGAITGFGETFLNQLKQNVAKFSQTAQIPEIVNSSLGDFNGALGAAALAVQQWKPVRK